MNKQRRKSIDGIVSTLNDEIDLEAMVDDCVSVDPDPEANGAKNLDVQKLADALDEVSSKLDALASDIEAVKDEEQESFDNMPESFQQGDRGSRAEEAISSLESAKDLVDEVVSDLNEKVMELRSDPPIDLDEVQEWIKTNPLSALEDAVGDLESAAE